MAFVNEYISEDDIKKYDLETLDKESEGYKRSWTIDRDNEIWVICNGSGKENDGVRWLFYWQSCTYRVTTVSEGAKLDGVSYHVRRKVVTLYDAHWQPVSNLDRTGFIDALKAAMEAHKAYGMANTDAHNAINYHIELAWGV